MQKVGTTPRFIMRNLAKQAKGYQKLGFLKHDTNNYVKEIRREALEYGDAEFILAYLEGKKSVDPSFLGGILKMKMVVC